MNIYKTVLGFFSLAILLGLSGCGGSSDTSTSTTGSLSVELTDAPGDYSAVYVTIDEIRVHKSGDDEYDDDNESYDDHDDNESYDDDNLSESEMYEHSDDVNETDSSWIVVATPHKTYNLLELQNGLTAELGDANISVGKYTQMRLILGDQEDNETNILGNPHPYAHYIIFADGSDAAELKVPSNVIKQKHNFTVYPDADIVLTIDFDANKSIVEKGNGEYILKPVLGLVSAEDDDDHDDEHEDENEDDHDDNNTSLS